MEVRGAEVLSRVFEFENSAVLDSILGSSGAEYLREQFGRSSFLKKAIPGVTLAELLQFDCDTFDKIINSRITNPSRIQVVHNGKTIEASEFSMSAESGVNPKVIEIYARDGGTIIVKGVEGESDPLKDICRHLGSLLCADVFINAYFTAGSSSDFGWHADAQHVLILQLAGRKRWEVGPVGVLPMPDLFTVPNRPDNFPVVHDISLEENSVLYVPQGTPHRVSGLGAPTLHLTLSVVPINTLDFVGEAIVRLVEAGRVPREIPVFEGRDDSYLALLKGEILDSLTRHALSGVRVDKKSHSSVGFRCGARSVITSASSQVRLSPSVSYIETSEDFTAVNALGRTWAFSEPTAHAVRHIILARGEWCPVSTVVSESGCKADDLAELSELGLVQTRSTD